MISQNINPGLSDCQEFVLKQWYLLLSFKYTKFWYCSTVLCTEHTKVSLTPLGGLQFIEECDSYEYTMHVNDVNARRKSTVIE